MEVSLQWNAQIRTKASSCDSVCFYCHIQSILIFLWGSSCHRRRRFLLQSLTRLLQRRVIVYVCFARDLWHTDTLRAVKKDDNARTWRDASLLSYSTSALDSIYGHWKSCLFSKKYSVNAWSWTALLEFTEEAETVTKLLKLKRSGLKLK